MYGNGSRKDLVLLSKSIDASYIDNQQSFAYHLRYENQSLIHFERQLTCTSVLGIYMKTFVFYLKRLARANKVVYHGRANQPKVALTFDDGPNPTYTPQILELLKQYNVQATFFAIGEHVQAYPQLVRQEYQEGHAVGNHTWTHPHLPEESRDRIQNELSRTSNVIEQATGTKPVLFRPPYGKVNWNVLKQSSQQGMTTILWSVDTLDWDQPSRTMDDIVNRALSEVGNGSILLLHDGGGNRSPTVAALPTIIINLQQRGYQFVTVQQMINHLKHIPR